VISLIQIRKALKGVMKYKMHYRLYCIYAETGLESTASRLLVRTS
jgi:hypothetical protein